jgi:hypothetical protein
MQSFVRDTRPFLSSSSHGNSGVSRSATADSVMRKSSSRHALYNHLYVATRISVCLAVDSLALLWPRRTPVIEDQIVPTDHPGGRYPSPSRRRSRNRWLNRLQQLGVVAILIGILRWRSGVKNPREKKLLMYLVASLGLAWSIQRVRSKTRK